MCSKENPEVLRESHSHQADFQNHPFICWKPRQRCSDWTWGKRSLYTSYPKRKKKKTPIYSLQPSVSPESELIRLSAPCAKINQTNRGTPDRLLQRGKRWSGAWAQQLQRPVSNGVYTKMPECPTCTALQSCTNIRSIPTEHVIELVSIDYFFWNVLDRKHHTRCVPSRRDAPDLTEKESRQESRSFGTPSRVILHHSSALIVQEQACQGGGFSK